MNISTTKAKVLIVDDEPQVRAALGRLATSEGFVPVLAASAEEALALAQADHFRAAITDVTMPGMGGLALLHRLSPLQPRCRFIVVTGLHHVEASLLPRGHGCQVFYKPWDGMELRGALRGKWSGSSNSSIPAPLSAPRKVIRLLLLESDTSESEVFSQSLRMAAPGEHDITCVTRVDEARELLIAQRFDVACISIQRSDHAGLDAIVRLQAEQPSLGIVVLAASDDEDLALRAVQAGAQDCLVKGAWDGPMLAKALRYARERKRAEMALSQVAVHDQVTGLANRTLFRQRVAQALILVPGAKPSFAVFVVDLHHFKAVNEAFGHDTGDAFLQEVGARLRRVTRETDTVARLGGDEFAVLVKDVGEQERALEFGRRILSELTIPAELGGVRLVPAAAIGVALCPDAGTSSEDLLAAAELALRTAKAEGRNSLAMYGAEVKSRALQRMALEDALRDSLKRGEFALEFQPQVNEGGTVIAAEALLRWQKPGAPRSIEANEFMSVMEETGLIADLGPWIIRTACAQLRQWRDSDVPVQRMAVNVAAVQVARHDLVAMLNEACADYDLCPADIELELTETSLLQDSEQVRTTLQNLKDRGYRLALDDFGTGFSSLQQLYQLPFDELKIDRMFVRGLPNDEEARAIVRATVDMAHALNIKVCAEGVETLAALEYLESVKCDRVQGYLLSPAVPPEEFESLLGKWNVGGT